MDELNLGGVCEDLGGQRALGNVDLGLAVVEVDVDTSARNLLAVCGWGIDVANGFALSEGVVGDLTRLSVAAVRESNKELTSGEGKEVVIDVSLDLLVVPDLAGLSLSVGSGNHLVEVGIRLHVLPERLSVVGVVATGVVLLSAVVGEGDTAGSESENLSLFQTRSVVSVAVQETSIVVVVHEHTKGVNV